ncbi:MAG: hypothetical protein RLZZ200_2640 [Pseudomonadota bacterium]|jgi:heat shock protein HtpX
MKRVILFLATNLAVLLMLTGVVQLLGLDRHLGATGGIGGLLAFAALFGFGGALISLLTSKWMARRAMGVQVITTPRDATEHWLLETVRQQAARAGIGMPEVGVFESQEPNAFATGARKDSALVAVSTGLLRSMRRDEVEAVLGHEVAHVANGDMVTLALLQGVVNTFVIVVARLVGGAVDKLVFRNEERGFGYFIAVFVAELVLGVLASMVVAWFSRQREYRADKGGAFLASRRGMIDALRALQRHQQAREPQGLPEQLAAFGISAAGRSGIMRLLMSHPPLEHRIAALERAAD